MVKVLCVCLGNICRSPTADGVFKKLLGDQTFRDSVVVDSAGTGDWHLGKAPDQRTQTAAAKRGYDLSDLRARTVTMDDFEQFDHILTMVYKSAAPNVVKHDWKPLVPLLQTSKMRRSKAPLIDRVGISEHRSHQRIHKACLPTVGLAENYRKGRISDYIAILYQR